MKRIGKIPVKCDYCGKTFMRYAGNVKNTTDVVKQYIENKASRNLLLFGEVKEWITSK